MPNSLYRRRWESILIGTVVSFIVVPIVLFLSFACGFLTPVGPIVSAPVPGPCGCGGRCCQAAEPPGMRAVDPSELISFKASRGKLLDDWLVSSIRLVSVVGKERTLLRTTLFPDDVGYEYEVLWDKPPQANGGAAYELEIYLRPDSQVTEEPSPPGQAVDSGEYEAQWIAMEDGVEIEVPPPPTEVLRIPEHLSLGGTLK